MKNKFINALLFIILILPPLIIMTVVFLYGTATLALKLSMKYEYISGAYSPFTGLFMCSYEGACLHEIGHWIDHDLDMPSQSNKFKKEVDQIVKWCREEDNSNYPYCYLQDFPGIAGNPLDSDNWGGYTEVYATIYSTARENGVSIPAELLIFYTENWNK